MVTRRGFFGSLGALAGAATVGGVSASEPKPEHTVVLQLDAKKMADIVIKQLSEQIRTQGVLR